MCGCGGGTSGPTPTLAPWGKTYSEGEHLHAREAEAPKLLTTAIDKRGEGTVDCETVASNRSTGSLISMRG